MARKAPKSPALQNKIIYHFLPFVPKPIANLYMGCILHYLPIILGAFYNE